MSFFSSLQEYVSSSVAGLSLSPKRFSLGRSETETSASQQHQSSITDTSPNAGSRSSSTDGGTHGFPKVVPTPGTTALVQNRRRTLECLLPSTTQRRPGSFRQQRQPKMYTDKTQHTFCCRRLSWPDMDHQVVSGVQDIDNSFFENFTALAWKQENQRRSITQTVEDSAAEPPSVEMDFGICPIDYSLPQAEKEKLYVDMLYTIANAVGAPAPGGQFAHYKDDLFLYGQRAFGVPPDRHYRMLNMAGEEKPPIVVLSVIVMEAEGLEAKDANGFSDPYCMLGIQPTAAPSSPQPPTANRTLSEPCNESQSTHEKLRKHHSFKLSFKRKDGRIREQRDSLSGALPAKFIRATSVKPHTLNPRWNEKFRFDIDDINSDALHLDIWDHDDESSVLEAVSKLNEVRGVRGLGRFFKQVCQSARQSSQDDFLGCVTVPLQDIPSTGFEGWFRLEARSQRSSVQGRIRLKLWLSTRENRGNSEEDNWVELRQHESLLTNFIDYEIRNWSGESWTWSGELPGTALTILHQHAVQNSWHFWTLTSYTLQRYQIDITEAMKNMFIHGDLTEQQRALAYWAAAAKIYLKYSLDPRWLLQLMTDLERAWNNGTLSREEEAWLTEAFTTMLERWLQQLRHHRQLFPALHNASLTRLEYLLRCLAFLASMDAFWKCCPFNKEIRGEIVAALRKGTPDWFAQLRGAILNKEEYDSTLVNFCGEVYVNLQHGLSYYHPLFENINGIPYFSIVFKQVDKLLADEIFSFLNHHGQAHETNIKLIFAVYLEIKDFTNLCHNMPAGGDHKLLLTRCHEWFEPAVSCWLSICEEKAIQRVHAAINLQKPCEGDKLVRHSSSAVDIVVMFCQLRDFWRLLQWPKSHSIPLLSQLLECVCSTTLLYGEIIHKMLEETGFFEKIGPFKTADDMCITANNLEYVCKFISLLENYFDFVTLETIATEAQYLSLTNRLDSTLNQLQSHILNILKRVRPQMQDALRKTMFHLAWSPECLPTQQAIEPLFDYLETHLKALNIALLPQNFQRTLFEVWEATLTELNQQMAGGGGVNNEEMPAIFHDRLHSALDMLVDFFHADGQGLSLDTLHSELYCHVEQHLQYHRTETEKLIEIFYNQRLQEQLSVTNSPYGTLAVRAYFNHDSLCVEVLHAKDVIPLDPNGFSDPFVIIELLPSRVFLQCNEQQTNVHKRTLNPIFDECFEFSVSLEQCRSSGAMIAFTVMDHDVLTANDFAGEAFLALGSIPGVANAGSGVDNFHGLKHVELILLQQQSKANPILQILESRIGDRLAIDFVKKQKLRMVSK